MWLRSYAVQDMQAFRQLRMPCWQVNATLSLKDLTIYADPADAADVGHVSAKQAACEAHADADCSLPRRMHAQLEGPMPQAYCKPGWAGSRALAFTP